MKYKSRGGKAPGAIRRAAKKTAKGKANVEKGMKMLGEANTTKETRKAGRTMARGIRQKKAGARKRANYKFRQAVKKGEETPTTGPGIGNLKKGGYLEGSKEVKFGGPSKVTAVKSKRGRGVVTEKGADGSRSITRRGKTRGKGDKRGYTTRSMTANKNVGTITKETVRGRGRADGKETVKTKTKVVGKRRAAKAANRIDSKAAKMNLPDKKFLGGRLAGAIKGFRGGKGQGLKARLAGAAKGAAGGGMLGRAIGAARGMRGAAGQGGGLRGMLKAGAQGAMQGAFGGGAQQNAAEAAAPAEGMEEEMMYGGKLKDRRRMGGPGGCKKGEPCDQGGGGKRMGRTKRQRQMDRQYRRAERRRRRSRRRGR